jgi:MFS family permease
VNKKADKYRDISTGSEEVGGGGGGISLRGQAFRSFKNPVFRLFYGGMLGQMAAMNMQIMARSLLVYRVTGSAAILGTMSLAHALPMICLSLFGGVIADRVQKKYVMLAGQAGSAVVSLGVALALTLGYLSAESTGSWWILIVSSVLQGIIMGLMMPSRQAIISEIVSGEQLLNAISLTTMGMNTLRILAPALTGFFIDAIGFAAIYYTQTGMYLIAVAFIAFMPLTSTITIRGGGAIASIREAFQYIRHETTILLVLLLTLFTVVLAMPFQQLIPIFTEDILKVGASGLGVLMSVSGVGAIVGSLILAPLPNRKRGLMMIISALILGLALVSFSFSSWWHLSLIIMPFVGLGQTGQMALSNTLIQYYVEDEYRGRVMSILMMQFGLMSVGTFIAGLLAESMGVQWAVGGFAAVLVLVSVLALAFLPRLRKLD